MSDDEATDLDRRRQLLSALVDGDGELDAESAELACRAWQADATVRADWHAYQLIGELMRSDEVRCAPNHDARLLDRFRQHVASQERALPSRGLAASTGLREVWRRAWAAPVALAAGFVALAGVLTVIRVGEGTEAPGADRSAALASAPERRAGIAGPALRPVLDAAAMPGVLVVDGKLIRNAELDRYLAAHKQYNSTSALVMPGEILRSTAAAAPGR